MLWYRTEVEVPALPEGPRLFLWAGEIDGRWTRAYLNGEMVGEGKARRSPFEVDVTGKLRKGKNTVASMIDHSSISELKLGGLSKPVMIYAGPGERADQTPGAK